MALRYVLVIPAKVFAGAYTVKAKGIDLDCSHFVCEFYFGR